MTVMTCSNLSCFSSALGQKTLTKTVQNQGKGPALGPAPKSSHPDKGLAAGVSAGSRPATACSV